MYFSESEAFDEVDPLASLHIFSYLTCVADALDTEEGFASLQNHFELTLKNLQQMSMQTLHPVHPPIFFRIYDEISDIYNTTGVR